MDELLALLSPGAVMAFLLGFFSMSLILQVAKENSGYSPRLKSLLLGLAWPLLLFSVVVFLGLLLLALLPVAQQYSVEIPRWNIDPAIFIAYAIVFVFTIIVSLGSSFVIRKLQKYLPKSDEEKRMEELSKTIVTHLNQEVENVHATRKILEDNNEILKSYKEVSDNNREITKIHSNMLEDVKNMAESIGKQSDIMITLTEAVVKHVEELPKKKTPRKPKKQTRRKTPPA